MSLGGIMIIGAASFALCCLLCGWCGYRAGGTDTRQERRELRALLACARTERDRAEQRLRQVMPAEYAKRVSPKAPAPPGRDTVPLRSLTHETVEGFIASLEADTNRRIHAIRATGADYRKAMTS